MQVPPVAVIRTLPAVTWVSSVAPESSGEDAAVRDGVTSTQSPTSTSADRAATSWVNFVVDVQLTATWPSCWLCTWAVEPLTAATLPAAPGSGPAPC